MHVNVCQGNLHPVDASNGVLRTSWGFLNPTMLIKWTCRHPSVPNQSEFEEGSKEILFMRATTKVDWHVNVWSEQISGPQIYQGKQ